MTALASITAVRPTVNTKVSAPLLYGATISAGQPVYLDSSNLLQLADSNSSATTAKVKGIAMTPGVNGGYGIIATEGGVILVGTTAAVGETYYAGATAGTIVPDSDLTTADYVSRIGTASSTTQIELSIVNTGIVHA